MLRVLLILIVFMNMISFGFANESEPVESTQGIEIDENVAKSKPDSEQRNEQKQNKNRSKKYLKVRKQTATEDRKRITAEKRLENLEKRLEIKKQKLELLNSNEEKGEKE